MRTQKIIYFYLNWEGSKYTNLRDTITAKSSDHKRYQQFLRKRKWMTIWHWSIFISMAKIQIHIPKYWKKNAIVVNWRLKFETKTTSFLRRSVRSNERFSENLFFFLFKDMWNENIIIWSATRVAKIIGRERQSRSQAGRSLFNFHNDKSPSQIRGQEATRGMRKP